MYCYIKWINLSKFEWAKKTISLKSVLKCTVQKVFTTQNPKWSPITLSAFASCFLRFPLRLPSSFCHCSEEPWLLPQSPFNDLFLHVKTTEEKKAINCFALAIENTTANLSHFNFLAGNKIAQGAFTCRETAVLFTFEMVTQSPENVCFRWGLISVSL